MAKRFIIILAFLLSSMLVYANTKAHYTELRVFNPYSSVSLKLLVKCDHDYRTKRYKFYKIVIVNRSSHVTIKAPVGLKTCEIWPIDMKMFGDIK